MKILYMDKEYPYMRINLAVMDSSIVLSNSKFILKFDNSGEIISSYQFPSVFSHHTILFSNSKLLLVGANKLKVFSKDLSIINSSTSMDKILSLDCYEEVCFEYMQEGGYKMKSSDLDWETSVKLKEYTIQNIFKDSRGILWIGTFANGIKKKVG